jgi:hypothetical protein
MTHNKVIVSGGEKPDGWPQAWDFPGGCMPPGWPRDLNRGLHLSAFVVNDSDVVVGVFDKYYDFSDRADGEYISLDASVDGVTVRMRKPGDTIWAETMLGRIDEQGIGEHGVVFEVEFDPKYEDDDIVLSIGIFGCTDVPAIEKVIYRGFSSLLP